MLNRSKSSCRSLLVCLILVIALAGCASLQPPPKTPEGMLKEAKTVFQNNNYPESIRILNDLLQEFPDSPERVEGLLLLAHGHYLMNEYLEAKFHYERFVELYPAHPKSAQAMYYRALCDYGLMDTALRDQTAAENAIRGFQKVIDEHPDSPFAQKAREKKRDCIKSLANNQMEIARFYFRTSSFLSAINRFRKIIDKYPESPFIDEAYFLLGESYYFEQNFENARKSYAQLVKSYPRSPYVREARSRLREIP
ncbi:outer membrane protein assembly factor BamD [Nitrospina gracilis]|uniref:outer membrane protein assembly factor BamD n=1 Tax=Nitrospina gracilis TaxID=35801 RepID=UPI001F189A5C|nr:outer membrane protein assembly factor BamD [Nitrospina gracilis]MCF8721237.1 outer membrane protein assembly factor BamD [Nitrospina gracilis Nb-211]